MSISLFFSILTAFVSAQFVMISGVFISSIIKSGLLIVPIFINRLIVMLGY